MRQTVNLFPIGYVRFESHNLHQVHLGIIPRNHLVADVKQTRVDEFSLS